MTPFLEPIVDYAMLAPISIWKQVKLVLFLLTTNISHELMNKLYWWSTSTIHKFTIIVCGFIIPKRDDCLAHTFMHQLLRGCMTLCRNLEMPLGCLMFVVLKMGLKFYYVSALLFILHLWLQIS